MHWLSYGPPLQGLDGEATEDVIRELQEPAREQQEPEVQYASAALMLRPLDITSSAEDAVGSKANPAAARSGLDVLVDMLRLPRATAEPTHVYTLLRLLNAACKLQVCANLLQRVFGPSG